MEANMIKPSHFLRLVSFTFFILLIGLASQVCAQENTFTFKNFSLSLPEGWSSQEIPKGSEKELIGSLKSSKIAGTTVLVFLYSAWRYNYNTVRIVGLKTIGATYPKGQEMLKKPTKMKTTGGYTANSLSSIAHGHHGGKAGMDTDAWLYTGFIRRPTGRRFC
jgi:hypothetical protein